MAAKVLALFLSNGGSLTRWRKEAILSREILLYLHFLKRGTFDAIQIFSYDAADHALLAELAAADPAYRGIELLTPPSGRRLGAKGALWGITGPRRHRKALARAQWLKTNQISGAWAAIVAKRLTGARLMLRMGYILSRRFRMNGQPARARMAELVERAAYRAADHVLVTAEAAANELRALPGIADKVVLTPTYVDVSLFAAKEDYRFTEPLIYVGRLTEQKNLLNLARAVIAAGLALDIVGQGPQEAEIRAIAAAGPGRVAFHGLVPNEALAGVLREHSIFVLPSFHEGLPKVLIEAMASGLICVGSRIPGIVDLIEDGRTGYLIEGFEPAGIRAAIERALTEKNAAIGRAARAAVEDKFSLARYAAREAALYG